MTADDLDLSGYTLTFDDEFDTFSWNGGGNAGTWSTTYSYGERVLNDETQLYTDPTLGIDPLSIHDGVLKITAAPTADPAQTRGQPYSSGVITTYGTFSQQYGVFEMRAKLPQGQGLWPAFWLLPVQHVWPPELDVFEAHGDKTDWLHWGASSATSAGSQGDWVQVPADITDGYHTYAVAWTSDTLTYYFDGQPVAQAATPTDMNQPMYLLANLAVGGHWPGDPTPDTPFPASMDIDYIRAYSTDPATVAPGPNGGWSGEAVPSDDTPAADTPTADTPAADTPAADTLAADTPAADTPAADAPAAVAAGSGNARPVDGTPAATPVAGAQSGGEVSGDAGGAATDRAGEAQALRGMGDVPAAADPGGSEHLDAGAEQVTRLYDAAFARAPDAAGLAFWTGVLDGGRATLQGVAETFLASPEYQAVQASLSDADFVQSLYHDALGRPGDAPGVGYWTQRLDAGLPRATALVAFSQSAEHVDLIAAGTKMPVH